MVTSARQHLPERTDRELVTAAREGDAEAFGLLVRRHQRRVYRLAVHLLKSGAEAEDVTQDTFVRAYGALDRFDGRSEPFTWIYRICVNLSLNALRSRKTRRASSPDDPRLEGLLVDNRPAAGSPAPTPGLAASCALTSTATRRARECSGRAKKWGRPPSCWNYSKAKSTPTSSVSPATQRAKS